VKRSALLGVLGVEASAVAPTPLPELEALERTLIACNGNQTQAAKQLGISRPALLRLMKKRDEARAATAPPDQKS